MGCELYRHFVYSKFRESPNSASEAIHWLKVLTKAGVVIPPSVIADLCAENQHENSISLNIDLLEIIWLQVVRGNAW